ncbi:MAG: tol-pal system protein YbgF [Desulfobacteraceae bacterium]
MMHIAFSKRGFLNLCLFIIIFFVIPLSSCVYDKEFAYLNDQMISLNKRVKNLEASMSTQLERDLDAQLESIRSNQAGLRVEIGQIQEEVKVLSGRVEDNEHVIKRTVERDLTDQDAMRTAVDDLSQKVSELEKVFKKQEAYRGPEAAPDQDKQERVALKIEPKSEELLLYDESLALFKEGRFEDAMDGFKDFLKDYPNSDRADNAQFWIGESYMALKQYEKAILAYQEVIKNYPKGNKVPNALLRQAAAFLEINDETSTKLLLKKIIKKYPTTNEAGIARKRLATLK